MSKVIFIIVFILILFIFYTIIKLIVMDNIIVEESKDMPRITKKLFDEDFSSSFVSRINQKTSSLELLYCNMFNASTESFRDSVMRLSVVVDNIDNLRLNNSRKSSYLIRCEILLNYLSFKKPKKDIVSCVINEIDRCISHLCVESFIYEGFRSLICNNNNLSIFRNFSFPDKFFSDLIIVYKDNLLVYTTEDLKTFDRFKKLILSKFTKLDVIYIHIPRNITRRNVFALDFIDVDILESIFSQISDSESSYHIKEILNYLNKISCKEEADLLNELKINSLDL